jgi:hypothetical protein
MFVIDSYGRHRRLSAKEIEANQESIRMIKRRWNTFDDETRMRATKTIRCLTTQGFFRYHSTKVFPQWAYNGAITTKISKHIFYTGIN